MAKLKKEIKKKGFTLIEILGVLVIMSIVVLITVPIITGIIDEVRKNAYRESVRSIFRAVDIYIADNNFIELPEEGIDVIDPKIMLKHKDFVSGKVVKNEEGKLKVERVSNGVYCAEGTYNNIRVVKGDCSKLDITPPTVVIISSLPTSNSVTVIALAEDNESEIIGYQFSKDNGTTWTKRQEENVYIFTELTTNTDYMFKARAYNANELMGESESLIVKTIDIPIPTYSIDTTEWSKTKTVTIHYPERELNYIYEYSLDNGETWEVLESPYTTKEILFTDNGNVIARILDGTNEVSGSLYAVTNIDNINPIASISVIGNPFNENEWANNDINIGISTNDNESGIDYFKYCHTTSEECTPNNVVNNDTGTVMVSTEEVNNRVCVQSYDKVGNNSEIICSDKYKLDKTNPSVVFNPNSNSTPSKSHSTKVTVNDTLSGINPSSLKYLWTKDPDELTENIFEMSFNNNDTITTPVGASGTYYLGILANDNAGNMRIQTSGTFLTDNLAPDVSNIVLTVDNVTGTGFRIKREGNAVDLGGSGLSSNPYTYQISTNKITWVTKCTNNSTTCDVTGLTSGQPYYYRVCAEDNSGNIACTNGNKVTPTDAYYCGGLSGTAVASDVLSGKTFYNSSGNLVTGSMPNRGAVSQTITSQGGSYTIPAGYHNGSGKVTASFSNLSAGNIKTGVNIGGVTGTFTSDATAVAGNILSGKTAYVNGNKVTGTMPNRGSQTTTLNITGASKPTKSISAGYISASTITAQVDSSKANIIKKGETLGGCEGTYDAHQIYTYTPADPVELGYWRSSDGTGIKSFSWNIPNVPFVVNKILIELYIVREYNAEEDRHRMRAIVSKNFDFGQPYSYDNGSYS